MGRLGLGIWWWVNIGLGGKVRLSVSLVICCRWKQHERNIRHTLLTSHSDYCNYCL